MATPLFVVLVLVETTDFDLRGRLHPGDLRRHAGPVPRLLVQRLRHPRAAALYFLLSGVIDKFRYLKFGLSIVLIFVGAKMLLADVYKVPIGLSLGIIALVIASSIAISLLLPPREEAPPSPAAADRLEPNSARRTRQP